MAIFPFSMHGVIFAKRTSPSWKGVYPFLTSAKGLEADTSIRPDSASTPGIGTKLTLKSSAITDLSSVGLISAISPIGDNTHDEGRFITQRVPHSALRSAHPGSPQRVGKSFQGRPRDQKEPYRDLRAPDGRRCRRDLGSSGARPSGVH